MSGSILPSVLWSIWSKSCIKFSGGLNIFLVSLEICVVEYIRSFLSNNHCDFLCLQELWVIDSDLHKLNNIHTDYTYVATSGMDSGSHFLSPPFGGGGILFKKSLSPHIKNSDCNSKRVCGILITLHNNFTCMLFIYLYIK